MNIYKSKKIDKCEKYIFMFREIKSIIYFSLHDVNDMFYNDCFYNSNLSEYRLGNNIKDYYILEKKFDIDKIIILAWKTLVEEFVDFDIDDWERFRYIKNILNLMASDNTIRKILIENDIDVDEYKNRYKEKLMIKKMDEGFFVSILLSNNELKIENRNYTMTGLFFKKMKYSVSSSYKYYETTLNNEGVPIIEIFNKNKKTNFYYQIYRRACMNIDDKRKSFLIEKKRSFSKIIKKLILQDKIWAQIIKDLDN